jgi:enoyl-CoA hydratase/carnithine racemase
LRACPKPVIAAVEGGAAGAGMSMALACDMLVAAENAFFTMAYVKVGLSPDGGATSFLSRVPAAPADDGAVPAGRADSRRAPACAGRREPADGTGCGARRSAQAGRASPAGPANAAGRIKRLCENAGHASLDEQLDLEAQLMAESQGDDEAQEGIKAFFEKRAPDFASLRGRTGD